MKRMTMALMLVVAVVLTTVTASATDFTSWQNSMKVTFAGYTQPGTLTNFHGYYDCYCYLPLYIFCGDDVLCAKLRPSNIDIAGSSTACWLKSLR